MPARAAVSKELADLFGVLSNPHRVRILQELRAGEIDVNGLQTAMGISHSGVSQHLSVLRAHRLVAERRDGRHVFYHLPQPSLAEWILEGLRFIEGEIALSAEMRSAVEQARQLWSNTEK
ncbi:MAG: winged helix-turn-helix transcriptional regulator [Bryobacterales bacterium]|nr:winged helix-turn-helix transcriptional regulator [Bryobacterales bacterium]